MIWQGKNMAKIFCIFVCDQITIFIIILASYLVDHNFE